LQLFLQLPNSIFNVASYFNLYHFISTFYKKS
jgi:hypothetical protein